MNIQTPIIIFSVMQGKDRLKDLDNHQKVVDLLDDRGIPHKVVVGSYKGIRETSILVSARYEDQAATLCQLYNQESYLYSGANRESCLKFLGQYADEKYLGRLVASNVEPDVDAWTYNEGYYYYCK